MSELPVKCSALRARVSPKPIISSSDSKSGLTFTTVTEHRQVHCYKHASAVHVCMSVCACVRNVSVCEQMCVFVPV